MANFDFAYNVAYILRFYLAYYLNNFAFPPVLICLGLFNSLSNPLPIATSRFSLFCRPLCSRLHKALCRRLKKRQQRSTFARSRFYRSGVRASGSRRQEIVLFVESPHHERSPPPPSRSVKRDRPLRRRGSPGRSPRIRERTRRSPGSWSRRRGSR
ncbi:hypothetical protein BHM03_00007920 [Ensete ventricosum]|nr:hypothetical protein BHM03_00007920 [Ensete ventricosum]